MYKSALDVFFSRDHEGSSCAAFLSFFTDICISRSSIDMAYWGFLRKDYFLSTWANGFAFDREMDFVGLMGRLGFGVAGSSKLLLMDWSGRVIVR